MREMKNEIHGFDVFINVMSNKYQGLNLIISKLGLVTLTGLTNKTSDIYFKPMPQLGGNCTCNIYDYNVGMKLVGYVTDHQVELRCQL